jgi:hypothetical protein
MALLTARSEHIKGRSHGHGWLLVPAVLFLVLLLLAIPIVTPISFTLGEQTFYAMVYPITPGRWPSPGRWGSCTARGRVQVRERSGRQFDYTGPVTTHFLNVAGWSYNWLWGKGRRTK